MKTNLLNCLKDNDKVEASTLNFIITCVPLIRVYDIRIKRSSLQKVATAAIIGN